MTRKNQKKTSKKSKNGMGSVDRLRSGRYRWRITVGLRPDGTPISVSGTADTEQAAHQAKVVALADHLRGGLALPERITVEEWFDRWLGEKKPRLAAKTSHNYQKLIERYIQPHLGRKRLQTLRPIDLHGLYKTLTDQGLTDTQRQVHNILYAGLQKALELELITRNPAAVVRPGSVRAQDAVPMADKALEAEEVAKLLPVLRESRWGTVFEFLLHTGLRRGEVCGLRWEHVDLQQGYVHIRENVVTVAGKVIVSTPKTERSMRRVYLSPEAVDCLRRQHELQALERQALGPGRVLGHPKTYRRKRVWQDTGYTFTGLSGVRLSPDSLGDRLKGFCLRAGVRPVTVHGLRHTYASLALKAQMPPELASAQLGHSRTSFTLDVYRTVYRSERRDWAVNLSFMLDAGPCGSPFPTQSLERALKQRSPLGFDVLVERIYGDLLTMRDGSRQFGCPGASPEEWRHRLHAIAQELNRRGYGPEASLAEQYGNLVEQEGEDGEHRQALEAWRETRGPEA